MLSIPHLIIIFIVALVVFGPEKLPELARTLGKVMGEFRRATGELRGTFEDHLRDLEREAEQRKIGGGITATKSAEGTVAADAPNSSTSDAPANSESAEPADAAKSDDNSAVAPAQGLTQTDELNSEKQTDGGTRTT